MRSAVIHYSKGSQTLVAGGPAAILKKRNSEEFAWKFQSQIHWMPQQGLCFVVQNSLANQIFVNLNRTHCVARSLDPSQHVVYILNKDGA